MASFVALGPDKSFSRRCLSGTLDTRDFSQSGASGSSGDSGDSGESGESGVVLHVVR